MAQHFGRLRWALRFQEFSKTWSLAWVNFTLPTFPTSTDVYSSFVSAGHDFRWWMLWVLWLWGCWGLSPRDVKRDTLHSCEQVRAQWTTWNHVNNAVNIDWTIMEEFGRDTFDICIICIVYNKIFARLESRNNVWWSQLVSFASGWGDNSSQWLAGIPPGTSGQQKRIQFLCRAKFAKS